MRAILKAGILQGPWGWERAHSILRLFVLCMGGVFTAYLTARIFWLIALGYVPENQAFSLPLSEHNSGQTVTNADYTILEQFDPFNRQLAESTPGSDRATKAAPETKLDLKLFGIRFDPAGGGSAVVKTPDGAQAAYRVGDALIDGVQLVALYPYRIEIRRGGVRESLFLEGSDRAQLLQTQASGRKAVGPSAVSRSGLGALMADLALEMVGDPRSIDGWRVRAIPDGFAGTGIDLEMGDIIVSANGQSLDTAERLSDLMEEIESLNQLLLGIVRDGNQMTVSVSINQ